MKCSTPDTCSKYATDCEACYGELTVSTFTLKPNPEGKTIAIKSEPKPPKLNRHERRERKRAAQSK